MKCKYSVLRFQTFFEMKFQLHLKAQADLATPTPPASTEVLVGSVELWGFYIKSLDINHIDNVHF